MSWRGETFLVCLRYAAGCMLSRKLARKNSFRNEEGRHILVNPYILSLCIMYPCILQIYFLTCVRIKLIWHMLSWLHYWDGCRLSTLRETVQLTSLRKKLRTQVIYEEEIWIRENWWPPCLASIYPLDHESCISTTPVTVAKRTGATTKI